MDNLEIFANLPIELKLKIIEYLDDNTKIQIMLKNKYFYNNRKCLSLNNTYRVNKIINRINEFKFVRLSINFISDQLYNLKYLKVLHVHLKSDMMIGIKMLPETLKELWFYNSYNFIITKNVLPQNLTTLIGINCFENGALPNSISDLTINDMFNQEIIAGSLPVNLKTLRIGKYYNQEFEYNVLPNGLHTLILGRNFNQPFNYDVLPDSLHTLEFGNNYNQPFMINVLPPKLFNLELGNDYNQIFNKNVLPKTLNKLLLGSYYAQQFSLGSLPQSLTYLSIIWYKHKLEENTLPSNLTKLKISRYDYELKENIFPLNLTYLDIGQYNYKLKKNILPPNLTYLSINHFKFRIGYDILPKNLKTLKLGYAFRKSFKDYNVINLIRKKLYHNEKKILPDSLIEIIIDNYYQLKLFEIKYHKLIK